MGDDGVGEIGFAIFLGVVGGDEFRFDGLFDLDGWSVSRIVDMIGCLPLGCTRALLGNAVLILSSHYLHCQCSVKNLTACHQPELRHVHHMRKRCHGYVIRSVPRLPARKFRGRLAADNLRVTSCFTCSDAQLTLVAFLTCDSCRKRGLEPKGWPRHSIL